MENQNSHPPPIKEIKIVSRKSNEELPDELAAELEADDQSEVDSDHLNGTKFHKNDDVGEGIED